MFKRRCKLLLMAVSLVPDMPVLAQNDAPDDPLQLLIDTDGKHHLHIRVSSYNFEPDHIIVKVNVPIELSISREWGIIPHTFVLKMPESGVTLPEESTGSALGG